MAVYSITNGQVGTLTNITTTPISIIQDNNTTTATRVLIQDVLVGAAAQGYATTDTPVNYDVARTTTTGTGASAANGVPLDVGYRAPLSTGWVNHAAATPAAIVTTNILVTMALNQRASQRWVAAPGSELVIPGTNNSGIAVFAKSPGYASTVYATMLFIE